jgi:hypothetical protein
MALLKRTLLLGLLMCLFGRESRAAEDKPIAIVHARLIDGMSGPPLENATVIVRGKTVEYAGPGGGATVGVQCPQTTIGTHQRLTCLFPGVARHSDTIHLAKVLSPDMVQAKGTPSGHLSENGNVEL